MEKFSILIVDDIEENIHSLKLMIEDSFDVNIYTALSAQIAIGILMEEEINLILSDIQMPDIDGFEFAEYLNGIEKTKDIPLIFLTGIYNKKEYEQKGYNLGAVEYISKPIDDEILSSKLNVYIDLFNSKRETQQNLEEKEKELLAKEEIFMHQAKMATMGEMIGSIVHQLKQPLNAISIANSAVDLHVKLDDFDKEILEKQTKSIDAQIEYMTNTMNDFRNFFKTDGKRSFNMNDSMKDVLKLVGKIYESQGIKIEIDAKDDVIVDGYQNELNQVIINIINNARDVILEKNVSLKKVFVTTYKEGEFGVMRINDVAGGIPEDIIDKIFDPYFTTKDEDKGTGIGLNMSKAIIEKVDGELSVENIVKNIDGVDYKGACFTIKIKLKL